jgi:hypothetical protein
VEKESWAAEDPQLWEEKQVILCILPGIIFNASLKKIRLY